MSPPSDDVVGSGLKITDVLNSKLADWDDDDPQAIRDTSSRWDKVVILKHLFTLKELEVRSPMYP